MRLINLDDALESIQREIANVACPNTVLYVLENRPTVEAIPIERIVKRINYYSDLILTYPNEKELLYSQTELISLLEEWEKENEQD